MKRGSDGKQLISVTHSNGEKPNYTFPVRWAKKTDLLGCFVYGVYLIDSPRGCCSVEDEILGLGIDWTGQQESHGGYRDDRDV
jgi:hypothetical protein